MPPRSTADEAPALRKTGALPLRPGDPGRIGPYVSLGLLGSGGMGRVYLGRPSDGGSGFVAVKVIRPEYAEDVRFRRRFEREAAVHGRVRTAHMPRLCGTGFEDELLWMATEYLPGVDLADAVHEEGPLPTAAVWRLVAELGQALTDLSDAGIVHRDLKPSNVLISARRAHVIDFGIAKAADASAITGTGDRVGTPAYMSPEYLRTGECGTPSDVFSLACALVYAATGSAPFGDGTGVDVMHRVAFEEPNAKVIRELAESDEALATLLWSCLAKEPGRRPTPQDLVRKAGPRTGPSGTSDWPEPLGGMVLVRQQAYEELCRLPLVQAPVFPAADDAAERAPAPAAGDVRPAAADSAGSSQEAPDASAGGRAALDPAVPTRTRRKRVLAVGGAGVALCAVAAGVFVLTRPDASTSATPQTGIWSTGKSAPDDAVSPSASGQSQRAPDPDGGGSSLSKVSGKGKDDGKGSAAVDGTSARPDASASADDDRGAGTGTDTPVDDGSDAPDDPEPTSSDPPADSGDPAWLTDCGYYAGSGRTRVGDSGKRVLQAECILSKRGYGVSVDGEFDSGTEAAVEAFQNTVGLKANGVVNRDTWAALRSPE
ncbi:protein kinase domain-containing protein [Streptomyces heilongjiangensis]|uniref:Protein kinase n=1 Tax=Streptomyces heilongjiangensis TaxID=945052 RepID=A0ABW1B629_9ACTN|nr:protein kinase [Streptomyces heilongjiangensis]MDC2947841.1 protein kinase [Streptomyces heilongjiangensis]